MIALLTEKVQFAEEKSKIICLWTSLNFIEGLIEFMEVLIAKKIDFGVNLNFNWKKLKLWGQIIIFLELIWLNQELNCINIKV